MSTALPIVVQQMWDVTIVTFQESRLLEASQLAAVEQELTRLVDEMDRKRLILDFTKVQFLASSAMGMLLTTQKKVAAIKGELVICGLRKELMRVFEIMKLQKVFKFAPTESAALTLLGYKAS